MKTRSINVINYEKHQVVSTTVFQRWKTHIMFYIIVIIVTIIVIIKNIIASKIIFLLTTCILLGNYDNSFGILYMLHQSALGDPPLIRTKNKNNLRFQNVCTTFISNELSIQNQHGKANALPCHHHMIICDVLGNLVGTICTI